MTEAKIWNEVEAKAKAEAKILVEVLGKTKGIGNPSYSYPHFLFSRKEKGLYQLSRRLLIDKYYQRESFYFFDSI